MSQETPDASSRRTRRCRRAFLAIGTMFLLLCGYRINRFLSPGPLEIGPETTVIDGPLLPDGRVDYVAALNQRMGAGVTPEINAAVPLIQAFGPDIVDAEHRREYFELLGVAEVPHAGEAVIDWTSWIRRGLLPNAPFDQERERMLDEQFYTAMEQPWSPEELPEAAAWLEANEAFFGLIVEASTRPRFYSPLLHGEDPPLVHSWPEPLRHETSTAAELLAARGMLRLGAGDLQAAWHDLLACHRLSRLVVGGETGLSFRVALNISGTSCRATEALVHHEQLTAEFARQCLDDLNGLPPMPGFFNLVDVAARFTELDAVQAMAHGNASGVSDELQPIAGRGLDWGLMMQITNERYDREVEAYRHDTYRARMERLEPLWEEMPDAEVGRVSAPVVIAAALIWNRRQVSRRFADVTYVHLAPALELSSIVELRMEAMLRLLRIALMLAAYRADHGSYPDTLDTLTPGYRTVVPLDPFPGEPFHYERTDTGYRLYSIGQDLTDDGGRTYSSRPQQDDILVETPDVNTAVAP